MLFYIFRAANYITITLINNPKYAIINTSSEVNTMFRRRHGIYFVILLTLQMLLIMGFGANVGQPKRVKAVLATSETRFEVQSGLPDPNGMLLSVNSVREEHNLPPLLADPNLAEVALLRARDMSLNNYYAHKGLDGKYYFDFLSGTDYEKGYNCENLDLNFVLEPAVYVNDWLGSKLGHRECLLNSEITRAGYAVAKYSDVTYGQATSEAYIVVAIHSQ
jgi:uncharacterized protein YkwD